MEMTITISSRPAERLAAQAASVASNAAFRAGKIGRRVLRTKRGDAASFLFGVALVAGALALALLLLPAASAGLAFGGNAIAVSIPLWTIPLIAA